MEVYFLSKTKASVKGRRMRVYPHSVNALKLKCMWITMWEEGGKPLVFCRIEENGVPKIN